MLVALTGHSPQDMPNTARLRSFLALAGAAEAFDLPFRIVQPRFLRFAGTATTGWTLDSRNSGNWIQVSSPLPSFVVYDAMYLRELRSEKKVFRKAMERLKQAGVPVFNPSFPNKNRVLELLQRDREIRSQVPPTWSGLESIRVSDVLQRLPRMWLKPVRGSGGRNLVFLQRYGDDRFRVEAENFDGAKLCGLWNQRQTGDFISKMYRQGHPYVVQEHICLVQTSKKETADLRITVQRNEHGKWGVTAITGRLSSPESLLTNHHAGGRMLSMGDEVNRKEWFATTGMTTNDTERAAHLALQVAQCIQQEYPLVGLLGIDIGQDVEGSQYVYDCNSRPGKDILTEEEVRRFMFQVAGFARYLADSKGYFSLHL